MENTMTTKIKLNLPCWICNKELYLGEAMVTFGDNNHKSPVHLKCLCRKCKQEKTQ